MGHPWVRGARLRLLLLATLLLVGAVLLVAAAVDAGHGTHATHGVAALAIPLAACLGFLLWLLGKPLGWSWRLRT